MRVMATHNMGKSKPKDKHCIIKARLQGYESPRFLETIGETGDKNRYEQADDLRSRLSEAHGLSISRHAKTNDSLALVARTVSPKSLRSILTRLVPKRYHQVSYCLYSSMFEIRLACSCISEIYPAVEPRLSAKVR